MTHLSIPGLVTGFSPERVFPFIEHDNGDITGYGHQDRAEFAATVNHYDRVLTGFSDAWTADDVDHAWAFAEEPIELCPEGTPDAVPITTLWGRRAPLAAPTTHDNGTEHH
jgi:hypothetical protein